MKSAFIYLFSVLFLAGCKSKPGARTADFPTDNLQFLDSLRGNKVAITWRNDAHLYDTFFKESVLPMDTFRSEVIEIDSFINDRRHFILVLMQHRPVNWDCHPCGPVLTTCVFEQEQSGEVKYLKSVVIDLFGSFGEPPETRFLNLGSCFAYIIEPGFTSGGVTTSSIFVYRSTDAMDLMKALEINPSSDDNSGMCNDSSLNGWPKCYSYETAIEFPEGDGSREKIKARKKGTMIKGDKLINIDSIFYYTFKNRRYELTMAKSFNQGANP